MRLLTTSSTHGPSSERKPLSLEEIDEMCAGLDFDESNSSIEEPAQMKEIEKEEVPESEAAEKSDLYWTEEDIDHWLLNSLVEKRLRAKGYPDVRRGTTVFRDYQGRALAFEIEAYNQDAEEFERHWVTLHIVGTDCVYVFSLTKETIGTVPATADFTESWLREANAGTKVVKSRPPDLYQEFFRVPKQEVWPQGAKILVVGDPFQACDREGTTLVDYEYAEEIVPPIVDCLLHPEYGEEAIARACAEHYANLHHEDIRNLHRMYGRKTPLDGNPYVALVDASLSFAGWIAARGLHPDPMGIDEDRINERFKILRHLREKLVSGDWSVDDLGLLIDQEDNWSRKGLLRFEKIKNDALEAIGKPEHWDEFINRWEEYLSTFPKERVQLPDIEKRLEQARYWLAELPNAKSPARVRKGLGYLENFYTEAQAFVDEEALFSDPLFSTPIAEATAKEWGKNNAFGDIIPGHPVSFRVQKFLDEAYAIAERMFIYATHITPRLRELAEQCVDQGVPFSEAQMRGYLNSYEQALIRSYVFERRTQKAVPLHGFFPYDMPDIDPQDRILALTSVTMHGWNTMNEAEFHRDIEAAIPFLKVGGKYILGPVNQHVYFGGHVSDFDADGLCAALKSLEEEGKISYHFVVGQRQGYNEFGSIERESEKPQVTAQTISADESAASLVITRLK